MPVDESRHDEVVNQLQRRYADSVLAGDEVPNPNRIKFDGLDMNYITGGGLPQGRWTRMYGGYSSTKTRTCWELIKNAQQQGLSCVYYDIEKQFHPEAVASAGVDLASLTIIEGTTIEQVGTALEAMLTTAHVHVIDSCSNAVSIDELEADLEDWRPGLMARAWGKAFRKAHERFDKQENTVVLIDQLRASFGRGKTTEEPPGGKFLGYLSSMSLMFRRGKWLFYDDKGNLSEKGKSSKSLNDSPEPDGREIVVRAEKSRVGRPDLVATLYFDLNTYQFDHEWEYVKAAKSLGIVEQKGSWWSYDGDKVQGDAGLRELVAENEDIREEISEAVSALHSIDYSRSPS